MERRNFLRGVGATMALPWLESLQPRTVLANASVVEHPVRMAFVYVPNGVIKDQWAPIGEGADYELSPTLRPLEKLKSELLAFTNLSQDNGRAKGDGAGDHARGTSTFLTGEHPYKTDGAAIRVGTSVDQVAAQQIGNLTALPSLELGVRQGAKAGNCDSGYSCAYSSAISWKSPTTPMPKEVDPRQAFERLFGTGVDQSESKRRRHAIRQSILDVVAEDAADLTKQLGQSDRRKIEEYFTSVRELEQRIERMSQRHIVVPPDATRPDGIPDEFSEHVRMMYDLMVLAFRTDSTRIATFMIGNAGDNRAYPEIGVTEGWHSLSHHQNEAAKIAHLKTIDHYMIEHFAYFLEKLQAAKEGEGTLLDQSMILYGSELGDGNGHTHHDLPILLAGRAGGTISPGRHIRYESEVPLNNLFLSMLDRVGASTDHLGDSTGRLSELAV